MACVDAFRRSDVSAIAEARGVQPGTVLASLLRAASHGLLPVTVRLANACGGTELLALVGPAVAAAAAAAAASADAAAASSGLTLSKLRTEARALLAASEDDASMQASVKLEYSHVLAVLVFCKARSV